MAKETKLTVGVEVYTSLIKAFSEKGLFSKAFFLMEEMKLKNIQPNIYTITTVMNACFLKGDVEAAKALLSLSSDSEFGQSKDLLSALHGSYVIGLSKLQEDSYTEVIDTLNLTSITFFPSINLITYICLCV